MNINITKKHLIFFAAFLVIASLAVVLGGGAPNPGHDSSTLNMTDIVDHIKLDCKMVTAPASVETSGGWIFAPCPEGYKVTGGGVYNSAALAYYGPHGVFPYLSISNTPVGVEISSTAIQTFSISRGGFGSHNTQANTFVLAICCKLSAQ